MPEYAPGFSNTAAPAGSWPANVGKDNPSGTSASRPAAAAFGQGYWFSIDTGSLDYSDGTSWTTGVAPSVAKGRLVNLASRLAPASTPPVQAVSADPPTVTFGTAATVTGAVYGLHTGIVTEVGSRGTWNNTFGYLSNISSGCPGLDFYLTGTAVEISFLSNFTGGQPIWIFVDGKPATAVPDTSHTTAAGTTYFMLLTFGSSARRHVEVFVNVPTAWASIRTDTATVLTPAPRTPVVGWVGDSFYAGSSATTPWQSAAFLASRALGVECLMQSFGGTGYTVAGSFTVFGSATRTTYLAQANPELIVISGSVNDDASSASTVGAAASACFTAYANACPNAKVIVFGPQPSSATATVSANRAANNAAIAAAAAAAPNVIAYHDVIGTVASLPAAWASGSTYTEGSLVTYKGSVWKWLNNGVAGNASSPGTVTRWAPLTWAYTGTGQVGTVVGDGTRDTLLYSDGVHPMPEAGLAMAIRQAAAIRADLLATSY